MSLRRATPSDAEAIARVEAAATPHPWSLEAIRGSLAQSTTTAFVHDLELVVGHLLTSVAADEGEVLTLAVHPDHTRRGLARALLARCFRHWTEHRVTTGHLEVRADNAPALGLYRSVGWTDAGTREGYYADGTDALLMRWSPS